LTSSGTALFCCVIAAGTPGQHDRRREIGVEVSATATATVADTYPAFPTDWRSSRPGNGQEQVR
jgi:hypothetical protein